MTGEPNSLLSTGGSGGSVLDRWVYGETPVIVFQSIYKYLEENWATIPAASKVIIKDLPCVPVGNNRLVKASRLYFRLTQDLSPFMFEVPRAFGAYDKLFHALGTRSSPSIQVGNLPRASIVKGNIKALLVVSCESLCIFCDRIMPCFYRSSRRSVGIVL